MIAFNKQPTPEHTIQPAATGSKTNKPQAEGGGSTFEARRFRAVALSLLTLLSATQLTKPAHAHINPTEIITQQELDYERVSKQEQMFLDKLKRGVETALDKLQSLSIPVLAHEDTLDKTSASEVKEAKQRITALKQELLHKLQELIQDYEQFLSILDASIILNETNQHKYLIKDWERLKLISIKNIFMTAKKLSNTLAETEIKMLEKGQIDVQTYLKDMRKINEFIEDLITLLEIRF